MADFACGDVDEESGDKETDAEASGDWGVADDGTSTAFNADSGTDFRARESTSTVSSKSPANRVIAKSRVCSFSRAAFRWRFMKSA